MKTYGLIIGSVIVTLVAAGGVNYWMGRGSAPAQEKRTPVRIDTAQRGDLVEIVQAPGEIQPRSKVSISAKISARIVALPCNEGDHVTVGQELVRLDAGEMESQLRSAQAGYAAQQAQLKVDRARLEAQRAQLAGAKATLADAERELQRQKALHASRVASQSAVDDAQRHFDEQAAAVDAAEHNLEAAEGELQVLQHRLEAADAEIARAKDNLSYTIITSPLDGVITRLNAKVGELVVTGTMNNAGTVIMEVADLSTMLVQARVDEGDIASVQVGQPVKVHIPAYPDRTFEGTVSTISLVRASEQNAALSGGTGSSRYYKTEILLKADGRRIYSGLTADAEIETQRHTGILKVPSQAVLGRPVDDLPLPIRDNNPNVDKSKTLATVVYRYVDDKAVISPVKVGPSDISHTVILGA